MVKFVKWNSLNQFHEVVKTINYRKYADWLERRGNKLTYYGKIKLHGTNASVTVTSDGRVIAGKRSSFMPEGGIGGDNCGFAAWVKKNEDGFRALREDFSDDANIIVYGEWCGPGVQSNVACSMTKGKFFYVFTVDTFFNETSNKYRYYEPASIEHEFPGLDAIDNVIVLPWHCKVTFDFLNPESMRNTLTNINKMVEGIGERDPFMFENFEIDGAGEGLVFYPVLNEDGWSYDTPEELELFSVFNFKAKSEHHRVNKTKAAVAANPEHIATQKRFAEMFCTEQRFEQAFNEAVNREKNMKLTSDFIKWCCVDVMKESETERETLDMTWDKLSKVVASRAAIWYKNKCMEA